MRVGGVAETEAEAAKEEDVETSEQMEPSEKMEPAEPDGCEWRTYDANGSIAHTRVLREPPTTSPVSSCLCGIILPTMNTNAPST